MPVSHLQHIAQAFSCRSPPPSIHHKIPFFFFSFFLNHQSPRNIFNPLLCLFIIQLGHTVTRSLDICTYTERCQYWKKEQKHWWEFRTTQHHVSPAWVINISAALDRTSKGPSRRTHSPSGIISYRILKPMLKLKVWQTYFFKLFEI